MNTDTRPTVGSTITMPAAKTTWRHAGGAAPLGYHVVDGVLWTNERSGTVTSVRKVRAGIKVATDAGFSVVI